MKGSLGESLSLVSKLSSKLSQGGGSKVFDLVVFNGRYYYKSEDEEGEKFIFLSNDKKIIVTEKSNKQLFQQLHDAYKISNAQKNNPKAMSDPQKIKEYFQRSYKNEIVKIDKARKSEKIALEEIERLYEEKKTPQDKRDDYNHAIQLIKEDKLKEVWQMNTLNAKAERKRLEKVHPYQGEDVEEPFLTEMKKIRNARDEMNLTIKQIENAIVGYKPFEPFLKAIKDGTFFNEGNK